MPDITAADFIGLDPGFVAPRQAATLS